MTAAQLKVIELAIKTKLKRGENLEDILESYVNLSEEEKEEFREKFA